MPPTDPVAARRNLDTVGARILAVPLDSLRRDPAARHKEAWVRLVADVFAATLLRFRDEELLASQLRRLRPSLLLTMNLPWYGRFGVRIFRTLPDSVFLITLHDDCRRQMHRELPWVLDRSDLVIAPALAPVLEPRQFPAIADKLRWLPYFIPEGTPRFRVDPKPRMRCLVSGRISRSYPMRRRALATIPRCLLEVLPHPGYWRSDYRDAAVGIPYLRRLHQCVCCLTCGSVHRCVVAKYLEIPWTGSLLVAENLPDLGGMGFRPNRHFLPIDGKTDLRRLVESIVADPDAFLEIRRNGQTLVLERHCEQARRDEARLIADPVLRRLGVVPAPASPDAPWREFRRFYGQDVPSRNRAPIG